MWGIFLFPEVALSVLVLLPLCCSIALTQSNVSSGEIKGTVTDTTEAVIPGAAVTVTNSNTGLTRKAATSIDGTYRILLLPPGFYEIRVELTGFTTQVRSDVVVTIGQTAALNFQLQVGAAGETITVTGEAPVI